MQLFPIPSASEPPSFINVPGTKDGHGCGDHDQVYRFGRRPRALAPFPFTPRQYARLLSLRGSVGDGLLAADDLDTAGLDIETTPQSDDDDPDNVPRAILHAAGVL